MSLRECVTELVGKGLISKAIGEQAMSLNERMQTEVSRHNPPASAEAAAALIAAKTLRDNAKQKLINVSANVGTFRDAERVLAEHPMGKKAGWASLVGRDAHRDAQAFRDLPVNSIVKRHGNVDGRSKSATNWLASKWTKRAALKPGFLGHSKDQLVTMKNMIYEGFGVKTGDSLAEMAWLGWDNAVRSGVERAKAAGKIFSPIEDWRFVQNWTSRRVKQLGEAEWTKDILGHHNVGLDIFDRDTGKPVTAEKRDFVLNRAFQDITQTGGESAPFSREHRTFVFKPGQEGADAYLHLMQKYGHGNNMLRAFNSHLERMGKEIGLIEVLGPNHAANWKALRRQALAAPEIPTSAYGRFNPARAVLKYIESPGAVDGMYKVHTGQVHSVHDDAMSNWLAAARNMNVANSLRQAVFSVFPTDSITQLLAGKHLGMDGIGHMVRVFTGGVSKSEAEHLHIQGHASQDFVNGIHDFENRINKIQLTGKIAEGVVKATLLDQWGRNGKRTWAGDMLNLFASQSKRELDKVHPNFKRFLDAYGFDAKDWDKIRQTPHIEMGHTRYLDPNELQKDLKLYDRVMSAIDEQGQFAMHQPDARIRSLETGVSLGIGPGRGQEIFRSIMQFKTFAISRLTTQMMRLLTDGSVGNRVVRGTAFAALSTGLGAAILQALQVINGKDAMDWKDYKTWLAGFVKGGAGGFYSDLIAAAMKGDKSSGDVLAELGGPLANIATSAIGAVTGGVKEELDLETGAHRTHTLGRNVVNQIRKNVPIRTWYTELAVERLLYDKLQTLVDPDYRKAWSRMQARQRKANSGYWWAPGESSPDRPPALSH